MPRVSATSPPIRAGTTSLPMPEEMCSGTGAVSGCAVISVSQSCRKPAAEARGGSESAAGGAADQDGGEGHPVVLGGASGHVQWRSRGYLWIRGVGVDFCRAHLVAVRQDDPAELHLLAVHHRGGLVQACPSFAQRGRRERVQRGRRERVLMTGGLDVARRLGAAVVERDVRTVLTGQIHLPGLHGAVEPMSDMVAVT